MGLGGDVTLTSTAQVLEHGDAACDTETITIVNPKITFVTLDQGNCTDVTSTFTFEPLSSTNTVVDGVVVLAATPESCSLEWRSIVKHGGDFYINDPRLDLLENTPASPAVHFGLTCPTVPRTFVNDATCQVVQTCSLAVHWIWIWLGEKGRGRARRAFALSEWLLFEKVRFRFGVDIS